MRLGQRARVAWLAPGLALGLASVGEAAKLHLRDSVLTIECHWTREDIVIVTRGGVAMRVPREDVVRVEDDGRGTEGCPPVPPEPTVTLGRPAQLAAPASPGPAAPVPPAPRPADAASLTPGQQKGLDDIRKLVNGTVRLYRLSPPVDVVLAPWLGSGRLESLAGVASSTAPGGSRWPLRS